MTKIKLFTHGKDLDGISCAILGILAFGKDNIDIEYCDYDDINERVKEFYTSEKINTYDEVFITDISVNKEIAKIIDEKYCDETVNPTTALLDHHKSALWLNDYGWGWANVKIYLEKEKDIKTSGTFMFYQYLINNNFINQTDYLNDFCETVRLYDTWEFDKFKNITEVYRGIKGFEKEYEVSNTGKVRSLRTNRILKPDITKDKFHNIALCKNGIRTRTGTHRLVAQAFLHNIFNYPEINHKDGDRSNNNINNLEWVSQERNRNHAYANKLKTKQKNQYIVETVQQLDLLTGKLIKVWDTVKEAENELGICRTNICKTCDGKDGRTQAGGFAWRWFYDKDNRYKHNYIESKPLNDLFYLYGTERFIDRFSTEFDMRYTDTDKLLLELNEEKKQRYIQSRDEELIIYPILINDIIHNIGVVFAEQYISELGNKLAILHPELDFIAIINKCGTVSLRGIKDDIDLSKIAECYGGGGHPKASGFEIKEDIKKRILHEIFINGAKMD